MSMHNHADGGSDLVVSFDAFKVSKHAGAHPWRVASLVPWARDLMERPEALGAATSNRASVLGSPRDGAMPDRQFRYGLGFERRGDAIDFLRDLAQIGEAW